MMGLFGFLKTGDINVETAEREENLALKNIGGINSYHGSLEK